MHGSEQGGEKGTAAISLAHILKIHGDKQRRPLTAELHLAPGHVARPRSAPGAPPHPLTPHLGVRLGVRFPDAPVRMQ